MVDLTRRKTVIGLGLLATGSGATLTSAAFSDEVEANSDFRVVAEKGLTVEPNANVDSNSKIANVSDPDLHLFNDSSSINESNVNLSGTDGIRNGGQAAVNDNTNGGLELAIAVAKDGNKEESFNILQVENTGDTSVNVGVTVSDYGTDVGGDITEDDVFKGADNSDDVFGFEIEKSTDDTFKEVDSSTFVSVGPGELRDLVITANADNLSKSEIQSAAGGGGSNVFGGNSVGDTLQLINKIKVGTQ